MIYRKSTKSSGCMCLQSSSDQARGRMDDPIRIVDGYARRELAAFFHTSIYVNPRLNVNKPSCNNKGKIQHAHTFWNRRLESRHLRYVYIRQFAHCCASHCRCRWLQITGINQGTARQAIDPKRSWLDSTPAFSPIDTQAKSPASLPQTDLPFYSPIGCSYAGNLVRGKTSLRECGDHDHSLSQCAAL